MMNCPYCDMPMDLDGDDSGNNRIVDTPAGEAHNRCYWDYVDDAPNRAADEYRDDR